MTEKHFKPIFRIMTVWAHISKKNRIYDKTRKGQFSRACNIKTILDILIAFRT